MIDLSLLQAPDIVETLDFETLFAERKARLLELVAVEDRSAMAKTLTLESEPIVKLLQESAYREMLLRQRVNDAVRAVMLSFAIKADLDHIGARYDVARMMIDKGDPLAVPPVAPTYESDDSLRKRIQLSFEAFSTAGPRGAYLYHALSAHPDVVDAAANSPTPGAVNVAVLSRKGSGAAPQDLLDKVALALNADYIRPMNDAVVVQSAVIVDYQIEADLRMYSGPDSGVVMSTANKSISAYTNKMHRLGSDITLSGIFAALHVDGVQNVNLTKPTTSIKNEWNQAGFCSAIHLTFGGISD